MTSCSLHVYSSQQLSKFVFSFIFQTTALTFMSLFFLSGLPNLCSASFLMFRFSVTAGAVCGASSPSLCLSSDWMDWFIAPPTVSPTRLSSSRPRRPGSQPEEGREKEGWVEDKTMTSCWRPSIRSSPEPIFTSSCRVSSFVYRNHRNQSVQIAELETGVTSQLPSFHLLCTLKLKRFLEAQ